MPTLHARTHSRARAFPPSARRAGLTLRAPCELGAAQVKLLKLLASKMDKEEQECLPLLLNVFYYRETLFIVYELLRDNLYHIYKYIEECRLPKYFTVERLQEVARQCLRTLQCLHKQEVIHCDLVRRPPPTSSGGHLLRPRRPASKQPSSGKTPPSRPPLAGAPPPGAGPPASPMRRAPCCVRARRSRRTS